MADTQLLKKLQYIGGTRMLVLNAPEGFITRLGLTGASKPDLKIAGKYGFVQLFAEDSRVLYRWANRAISALEQDGILWICYPKKTGEITSDLTRDQGWQIVTDAGYRGIRQVSIDNTWSAVRFKPAKGSTGNEALRAQYSGQKKDLMPVYEHLVAAAQTFGDDVHLHIRKSYVAMSRRRQFMVIKPATAERVDLGLKLKDQPVEGQLEEAKNLGSGSMTHKIILHNPVDVNNEVVAWMKKAYDQVGE